MIDLKSDNVSVDEILEKYKNVSQVRLTKEELAILFSAYQNQGNTQAGELVATSQKFKVYYAIATTAKHLITEDVTVDDLTDFCLKRLIQDLTKFDASSLDNFDEEINKSIKNSLDEMNKIQEYESKYSPEIVAEILPKLPLSYQEIAHARYIEGLSYRLISKKFGLTKQQTDAKLQGIRFKIEKLIEDGYKHLPDNDSVEDPRQTTIHQNIEIELERRLAVLDIETEVYPYLTEGYRKVFDDYMLNYTGKNQYEISMEIGKRENYVSHAIPSILKKLDKIIKKKQEIEKFYQAHGGKKAVEDLEFFLDDDALLVLREHALSVDPEASRTLTKKYNKPDYFIGNAYDKIENAYKLVLERKKKCDEFIKSNGGRDFLANDFAKLLNENHKIILTKILMDYHYLDLTSFEKQMGWGRDYINESRELILKKLENFKKRIKEVDEFVESVGGLEAISEFRETLSDEDKIMFDEFLISYNPLSKNQLAVKLNCTKDKIYNHLGKMEKRLQLMAENVRKEREKQEAERLRLQREKEREQAELDGKIWKPE